MSDIPPIKVWTFTDTSTEPVAVIFRRESYEDVTHWVVPERAPGDVPTVTVNVQHSDEWVDLHATRQLRS